MMDWTAGYVADIDYTYGYYPELNPLRLKLAFLNAGLAVPEMGHACELGFGQGLGPNIHAAASQIAWHGTDFNPGQAGFAQELAREAGTGAQLVDDAFDQFAAREDVPDFDYIGLHGIWSWVSDENRRILVDFVRRKLKVGGVLYVSYNTLPGWAAAGPLQHLMSEHATLMSAEALGSLGRVDGALGFVDALMATNPTYFKATPQLAERVAALKTQNKHYVAHEYFNQDWCPMAFADMGRWLYPAKMQWACSAHYLDAVDAINLTGEQQTFLAGLPDPMFRQTVRDYCVNQQFRKDYWVKGARKLSALEQAERLRAVRVILIQPRADVKLKVKASLGEATMQEAVYGPILDILADHVIRPLGEIEHALKGTGISFGQLLQAVMILCGSGAVAPAQEDAAIASACAGTGRLNTRLLHKARSSADISYLASPVTGGGIVVPRFQQLFLLGRQTGHDAPKELARFVWSILTQQGQKVVKDGVVLEKDEENLLYLTQEAEAFVQKQWPVLKALQIS